jgi:hypothetical protein
MAEKNYQKNKGYIITVGAVIILSILIFTFRTAIYQEFNNLKLVPEKETFTELYFDDPNNLPRVAVRGERESFSFTIHNVEGIQITYPYIVYFLSQAGRQTTFVKGSITINSDDSEIVNVHYTLPVTNEKGMVIVSLTSLNQKIDFLLPDTN